MSDVFFKFINDELKAKKMALEFARKMVGEGRMIKDGYFKEAKELFYAKITDETFEKYFDENYLKYQLTVKPITTPWGKVVRV